MTSQIGKTKILIDEQDYHLLSEYSWWAMPTGYIATQVKRKTIYLHSLIAGTPKGMQTDHINQNKADNRKKNLRVCDASTNRRNTPTKAKSGYRFVYKDKHKTWPFTVQRENKTLGRFKTLAEAVNFTQTLKEVI